jgi:hypothetical protein
MRCNPSGFAAVPCNDALGRAGKLTSHSKRVQRAAPLRGPAPYTCCRRCSDGTAGIAGVITEYRKGLPAPRVGPTIIRAHSALLSHGFWSSEGECWRLIHGPELPVMLGIQQKQPATACPGGPNRAVVDAAYERMRYALSP